MEKVKRHLFWFVTILVFFTGTVVFSYGQTSENPPQNKYKLALVLSGGAALGYAHMGVIKVLRENHITLDLIVGTSIGAIVGGNIAAGIPVDKLIAEARGISLFKLFDFKIMGLGFFSWNKTEAFLRGNLDHITFRDLKIPFAAVATDLYSGKKVVLGSGDVVTAMLASASIPGIYTPVKIDGHLLIDGGIVEDLPVPTAKKLGAEHIIAVDVHHPLIKNSIKTPFDVIRQAIYITQQNHVDKLEQNADIVIRPDLHELSYMNFDDVEKGVETGAKSARAALPQIKALVNKIQNNSN